MAKRLESGGEDAWVGDRSVFAWSYAESWVFDSFSSPARTGAVEVQKRGYDTINRPEKTALGAS